MVVDTGSVDVLRRFKQDADARSGGVKFKIDEVRRFDLDDAEFDFNVEVKLREGKVKDIVR